MFDQRGGGPARRVALPRLAAIGAVLVALTMAACTADDDADVPAATAPAAQATEDPTQATTPATQAATPAATQSPAATAAAETSAEALTVAVEEGDIGPYLVGPEGRTLYIFLRDEPGTTNCSGECLENWPPLLEEEGQQVEADAAAGGSFGSIETPSGLQVTYNDAPLYYFDTDAAAGDTNGQDVGGVWFVARPATASTSVVGVLDDGSEGTPYLVGPNGMTLYTP